MQNLPQWIKKILTENKLTCGKCGRVFDAKELLSVGIQKSSRPPHKEVLALGIFCDSCNEMTIFELQEMTLLDLSFDVLAEQSGKQVEQITKESNKEMRIEKKNKIISKRTKRSKITLREIRETTKFLNEINNHDDLLLAMGMTIKEIEKYKKQSKKKR
jgi:hypothetical protein